MSNEIAPDSGKDTITGGQVSSAYSLRVGGGVSGQVVVGEHNVLISMAESSSLTVRSVGAPPIRPRRQPVGRPLPRRGPPPIGRDAELARIIQAIEEERPVQIFGVPGVGKSTLLRELAAQRTAAGQDVVYLPAAGMPAEDVVQELFQACYEVDDYRPDPERLRRLMSSIRAMVMIDDFGGSAADLAALLDAAPAGGILVTSVERSVRPGGLAVALGGLGEEPALALLAAEAGRPLGDEELRRAGELWQAARGHPLALLQAWSALQAGSTAAKPALGGRNPAVLAAAITPSLSMPARQLLAVLCAVPGLAVSADLLAALGATPAAPSTLAELIDARLVQSAPGGYQADGELATLVTRCGGTKPDPGELVGRFITWMQTRATLHTLTDAAPVVLHLLSAATAGGHDSAVRDLARLVAPVLARTLRWGSWHEVLMLGAQAAHRLGSAVDQAYFASEEGIRKRALLKGTPVGVALSGALAVGSQLAGSGAAVAGAGAGSGNVMAHGGFSGLLAKPGVIGVLSKPAALAVGGAVSTAVVVGTAAAIAFGAPKEPPLASGSDVPFTFDPATSVSAPTSSATTSPVGTARERPAGGTPGGDSHPSTSSVLNPTPGPIPPPVPIPESSSSAPPPTTTTSEVPPSSAGDFTVTPYNGGQCYLRNGQYGNWDVDMWFSIPWTSAEDNPVPAGTLRLITDVGRSKDWNFSVVPTPPGHVVLHQPGNWVDTSVDPDDSYLNRLLRVNVTVDPDDTVSETAEDNNTIVLVVDLQTSFPPPDTSQAVNCYQE